YRPQTHSVYIIRILHQQMEPLRHFHTDIY
ncbi:type II toxin-antitoxin system RelE/ParE family toxin, partial [Vibrio parahaemolyticus]|nr:type II toxin-antitoxin system RelE/ParE family toxin [Vibrio parahaemolyticus]